jgi:hypothetical protein
VKNHLITISYNEKVFVIGMGSGVFGKLLVFLPCSGSLCGLTGRGGD